MATTKPRITVTLTKRQHEVLRSISENSNQPMSTFISEMLEAALPTLERMAVTFQRVKEAQQAERTRFLDSMDRAQAAIEPVVLNAVGQFDLFLASIEEAVGAGSTDARERAGAPVPTAPTAPSAPATNRGATPRKGKAAVPSAARISSDSKPRKNSKKPRMPTA